MNNIRFLLLLIIGFWGGCTKDNTSCISLPKAPSNGWAYISADSTFFSAPCFNPNNSTELVMVKHTSGISTLCTYNMQTQTLLGLYSGNIFYEPSWGSNGWILFDVNNLLYKIKYNGDSLTELTFGNTSSFALWSSNSNEYLYNYSSLTYGANLIANSNGVVIDSIEIGYLATPPWFDSIIIGNQIQNTTDEFVVYNMNTKTKVIIPSFYDVGTYSGGCFINSSEFMWADRSGIYITNIQTKETSEIKKLCNSITYLFPNYSWLSNKVVWRKIAENPANKTTLNVINKIVIMNTDGTNEQEINTPH